MRAINGVPSFRFSVWIVVLLAIAWMRVEAHGDHDIKNFHRSRGGSLYGGGAWEAAHHLMPSTDTAHVEHYPPSAIMMPENATDEEIWLMSGDLANYRSLTEIISVSLPVPINLIFVGFDGDGEHGLELVEDNFDEWFEHIDHFVRHRIVPVGEEQTTTERYKTPKTHVKFQLNYNLVKLDPLVNVVVEDVIYWHLRPEDPHYRKPDENLEGLPQTEEDEEEVVEAGQQQEAAAGGKGPERFYVDAFKLSRVLYHLLLSLNLTDSYTLFVLNPKKAVGPDQVYGYRVGFSDAEIQELQKRNNEWSVTPQSAQSASEMPDQGLKLEPSENADLFPRSGGAGKNGTYRTLDLVQRSQEWAHWYIKHMVEGGVKLAHLCTKDSAWDDPNCLWKTQRAEERDIVKLAQMIAESGSKTQLEYLASIKDGKAQEDCLVDNWIGHARYAWLDLSAGPFKWGPVVAGQGVRSYSTLPRVPAHYALHPEADPTTEHVEEEPSPSPQAVDPIASKAAAEAHKAKLSKLKDELVVLRGIYEQRCNPYRAEYCAEMGDTIANLEEQVKASQLELMDVMVVGDEHEGEGALLMLDNFLAHLASVISRTVSHVIVPASPLFPAYYTPRITFHFFLIANHRAFNPRQSFDFDQFKAEMVKFKLPNQEFAFVFKELDMSTDKELTMAFTQSLRTSVMPTLSVDGEFSAQTIRYLDSKEMQHLLHLLNIHSHADEELEKRAAKDGKVSTGHDDDDEEDDEDGASHHDSDLTDASALPERSGKGQTSRHIPIFFFSLNDVVPVFIDKYYQAKALSNVVLAVQSQHFNWTSKLGCNGKPIQWDLRDPLKALLGATALHYGGLIPMHITYDEPNQCAAQDWLWSVGDNPQAHTSRHHRFTLLQRDLAFRNFIVNAIEDSVLSINKGINSLSRMRTSKANFGASHVLPLAELTYTYKAMRRLWDSYAKAFSTLDYASGVSLLHRLEEQTKRFKELVLQTEEYLDVTQCAVDGEATVADIIFSSDDQGGSWWVIPASITFNIALVLLWALLRKTSRKVKTN